MTKLTLPIEIGRRYVRRDGKVVTPWECGSSGNHAYVDAGLAIYLKTGRHDQKIDLGCDLIADAPEEPTTYAITDYADVPRANGLL